MLNAVFIKQPLPRRNNIYTFPVYLKTVLFVIGYNKQVIASGGRRCFKESFYLTFTGLIIFHAPCNLDKPDDTFFTLDYKMILSEGIRRR